MTARETWGDFEVDTGAVVGRGGTSTVYAARQISLDRPCVVKAFDAGHRDPAVLAELARRFQNEAKLVARLSDPRIVQVFAAGEHRGRLWIAMERVDGETLEARLKAGQAFPEGEVRRIVAELCRALKVALAEHNVVHRDLKPGNVFLARGGQVKLSDFGLARTLDRPGDRITQAGSVMGTPEYLSPEAIRGEPTDHRADIYALGCLAYELVAQLPPFDGASHVDLFFKHVNETPIPPRQLVPEISEELNDIILKCLAKEAVGRYPDYETLLADLEVAPAPTPAAKRRPVGVLAAAAVAFALFGLAIWRMQPSPEPTPPGESPRIAAPANPAPDKPAPGAEELIEQGDLEGAAGLLEGDRTGRLALVLAALGRYEAARQASPDASVEKIVVLAASRPIATIDDLGAEAARAREIERLARSLSGRHAGAAWRLAAETFGRLGARLRADESARSAKEAWPAVDVPPAPALDLAGLVREARAGLEAGRSGGGAAVLAVAHELGIESLLNEAMPLRGEIEAAERLEAGDEAAVLRSHAGTMAHGRLTSRLLREFRAGGFDDRLAEMDRWKVKAEQPGGNRVEMAPGRLRLTSPSPAYLEYDGVNPPGFCARIAAELDEQGWTAVIVRSRGDEDMDLVVADGARVRCVHWREGEERELATSPRGEGPIEVEVVPCGPLLAIFVGGRFLYALEPPGAGNPSRLRIGVCGGTISLEKVEFRR